MADIGRFEPDDLSNIPTYRAAYSDRTALLMAKLAFRAYNAFDLDDATLETFTREMCQQGFVGCSALIDRDVGTAGYIVEGNDIIAVVFRGTQDELDWKTNVNARFVALQGGTRVHTGFFQAYWPIRDLMFDVIRRVIKVRPRPVYITGHSLGGALALMATAELANDEDAIVRDCVAACYTFGCPRAGDASFDTYVKAPLYRITNGVDIVPAGAARLSPCWRYQILRQTRHCAGPAVANCSSEDVAHVLGRHCLDQNRYLPERRRSQHGGVCRKA